ncbi:MAG: hypothetical protein WAO76_08385, partial [Georgfuchsia sp.]
MSSTVNPIFSQDRKSWSAPYLLGVWRIVVRVAGTILGALILSSHALAAPTITNVTLNGGSSVVVQPGATISATMFVHTDNVNWRSSEWRIATTPPGATTCVNHTDHNGNNQDFTETFNVTAPGTNGTYNAYFQTGSDNGCGGTQSSVYAMSGSVIVDGTAPTVTSINRVSTSPTNAATVQWTVTFSESVTGVVAARFALVNSGLGGVPAITGVSGSGASYTVTASTGSGNGTLGLNMTSVGSVADIAGNALTGLPSTGQLYTIDRTAPTIPTATIASNNTNPALAKVGDIVTLSFTTNDLNGVQTPVVTIAGGAAAVSGGPNSWTATRTMLAGDATGVVAFTINVNDVAGNAAAQSTTTTNGSSVTFDKTPPTLTTVTISSNNANTALAKVGNSVTLTFTASESVKATPTVTIAGHVVTPTPAGPTAGPYTATYVMVAGDTAGVVPFTINFTDLSGNAGTQVSTTTNGSSVTFDKTAPTVSSINRVTPTPTNAASVQWTVTFSESVTGVASGNFTLVNSGLGGTPAITGVSGSGTTWTVTASTGSGSGTLSLNMTSAGSVIDTSGNAVTGLPSSGQLYTIDRTAPAVSSITRDNPTPTALSSVSWTVTFSETITGVDASDFSLVQTGGVSGASITGVTPVSGTVYTVT